MKTRARLFAKHREFAVRRYEVHCLEVDGSVKLIRHPAHSVQVCMFNHLPVSIDTTDYICK